MKSLSILSLWQRQLKRLFLLMLLFCRSFTRLNQWFILSFLSIFRFHMFNWYWLVCIRLVGTLKLCKSVGINFEGVLAYCLISLICIIWIWDSLWSFFNFKRVSVKLYRACAIKSYNIIVRCFSLFSVASLVLSFWVLPATDTNRDIHFQHFIISSLPLILTFLSRPLSMNIMII